jgi:signal transduction histidine kinase
VSALLDYLPRGNTLSDEAWNRRHLFLQWVLLLHLPALYAFGLWRGYAPADVAESVAIPFACLVVGHFLRTRRLASVFITAGLVYCSAALVGLSGGSIEAHFHFFIMIGFIALYQDWVPFLWNIGFTVLSHGFGSAFRSDLMFNHHAGIAHPWTWSVLHGAAVLAACIGVVIFWKQTEAEQQKTLQLNDRLAEAEINRRRFTSDLLVNLARRNQNLLYRQLDLINQLEENEADPDALSDLFRLDHLATRIRRNAESLLVLSGEEPVRRWTRPVPLADVVRAAIAEIEDLDRVDFAVDERLAVSGRAVADLTHLLAELLENAVHFSPPGISVMLRTRPYLAQPGAQVLTIEDWGVGMPPAEMTEANDLLARPRDVDLSVSQRLGLHVVARLAQRYGVAVSLTPTPGGGVTAVVVLPAELFADSAEPEIDFAARRHPLRAAPPPRPLEPALTVAPGPADTVGRPALAPAAYPVPAPAAEPMVARMAALTEGRSDNGWHSWWTPHQPAGAGHDAVNGTETRATIRTPPTAHYAGEWAQPDQAPAGRAPAERAPAERAPADESQPEHAVAERVPPGWSPSERAGAGPEQPQGHAEPQPIEPAGDGGGFPLRRRVPQASLANQLRNEARPVEPSPLRDPEQAREALSRFQASQRAAREALGGGLDATRSGTEADEPGPRP